MGKHSGKWQVRLALDEKKNVQQVQRVNIEYSNAQIRRLICDLAAPEATSTCYNITQTNSNRGDFSMQEMQVSNFPTWTMYVIALSQIVFALATAVIAFAAFMTLGQVKELLKDVGKTMDEVNKKMPSMMNNVDATVGNVKGMSDDARTTTGHVTSAVDRVSHLAHNVAERLESPLVKSVGIMSGVLAGARALRGSRKTVVVEERRGLLGKRK
jgi:uncharacterized protein YoxC